MRFKTVNFGAGKSLVSPDGELVLTRMIRTNETEVECCGLLEAVGWAEVVACAPKFARGVSRQRRQCGRPCKHRCACELALWIIEYKQRRSNDGVLGAASLQWRKA